MSNWISSEVTMLRLQSSTVAFNDLGVQSKIHKNHVSPNSDTEYQIPYVIKRNSPDSVMAIIISV